MSEADLADVTVLRDAAALSSRRLWSREEFERAGEAGVFGPDERLELIGGEVIRKVTPQRTAHATAVSLVEQALRRVCPPDHHVRVQLPLALDPRSEPEPDVCVVIGSARDYRDQHPTTAVLIVEVADTTLTLDRSTKAGLYSQAGIPEYWIVNVRDRVLEVHREPAAMADQPFGHHYRSLTRHTEADKVALRFAGKALIAVADLLP